jgi:hypothetical protein
MQKKTGQHWYWIGASLALCLIILNPARSWADRFGWGGIDRGDSWQNNTGGGNWWGGDHGSVRGDQYHGQPSYQAHSVYNDQARPSGAWNHRGSYFNRSVNVNRNIHSFNFQGSRSPSPKVFYNRQVFNTLNRPTMRSFARSVPQYGPHGAMLHAQIASTAPTVRTMGILAGPQAENHFMVHSGPYANYSWHDYDGFSYCYYRDQWDNDWYGWYGNNQFYWTLYYDNYWWWNDPGYGWCYWNDNNWWWDNPQNPNVVYVYANGNFRPYHSAANRAYSSNRVFKSPDGSRVVKIYGSTRDAFLYDAQNVHAFHPIYLTSHVKKVEFSRPKPGHPLQIIVEKQNGTFEMFNAEGEAYTNSAF